MGFHHQWIFPTWAEGHRMAATSCMGHYLGRPGSADFLNEREKCEHVCEQLKRTYYRIDLSDGF